MITIRLILRMQVRCAAPVADWSLNMARFLHQLGRFSARHPWPVVSVWLAVLVAAITAFLVWGGSLGSSVTIPGTPTAQVTARLQEALPKAAGGTGTVVFATKDGAAFTREQKQQISAAIDRAAQTPHVEVAVDPFATEHEREARTQELTTAELRLAQG